MKQLTLILSLIALSSCASGGRKFVTEKTCSASAVKYLNNPRNKGRIFPRHPMVISEVTKTTPGMQQCYEQFQVRTGQHEFQTCLVVGVDKNGRRDFFNFSSEEARLDKEFLNCARKVVEKVPYDRFGKNYILVQSYNFHYQ